MTKTREAGKYSVEGRFVEPQMPYARSWLCPEPGDRERLLDMTVRLRKARASAMACIGVGLLIAAPWVGWAPFAIAVGIAVVWQVIESRVSRVRKPEWVLAAGWLLSVAAIAVGIALTGMSHSPAKSWLAIPALTLPARFTRRGLYAGTAICLLTLALVTIGLDFGEFQDDPDLFIFPAALICAAMCLSMALRDAELQHRSEAVIDQLTGMLNRKALEQRTLELELQSRITGQPVGLIVCDIDRFKSVNDEHGHAMGDAVLKDVAYRIRKELRAYDLAYRLGGEEFVVLVPGGSLATTHELAERLRESTQAQPVEGIDITASFGVAASGGGGLNFEALFEEADQALYRAKTGGRNRVSTAGSHKVPALV